MATSGWILVGALIMIYSLGVIFDLGALRVIGLVLIGMLLLTLMFDDIYFDNRLKRQAISTASVIGIITGLYWLNKVLRESKK